MELSVNLKRIVDTLFKNSFIKEWVNFLSAIFKPNSLGFILLGLGSLYFAVARLEPPLSKILSVASSLFLTFAGVLVERDLGRHREESALKKKGLSAIRNLGALEKQLKHLVGWVATFISGSASKKRDLSEVRRHLETMQLSIRSGLEDWVDIVPELKRLKEAEERYLGTIEAYDEEILENKKKLLKAGEDEESRKILEFRIKELEDSVEKLRGVRPTMLNSAVSGTPLVDSFSGAVLDPYASRKVCSHCGRTYQENTFAFSKQGVSFGIDDRICPDCERMQKSPGSL